VCINAARRACSAEQIPVERVEPRAGMNIYIYVYIYRERERDVFLNVYMYISEQTTIKRAGPRVGMSIYIHIYIYYMYICVCVCVCMYGGITESTLRGARAALSKHLSNAPGCELV